MLKRKLYILVILFLGIAMTTCKFGLTTSTALKEWTIDEYRVIYSKKIGPVGPYYHAYDIYKKEKLITIAYGGKDTCVLSFRERNDYYVNLDLCRRTKKVLTPNKEKLELKVIDSITIRPYSSIRLVPRKTYTAPFHDTLITKDFDSTITKRLNEKEIKSFVKSWNKANTNGLERFEKNYDYLLTVYSREKVRKIKTLNNFLTDEENWSYEIKEKDTFFDDLWEKKQSK